MIELGLGLLGICFAVFLWIGLFGTLIGKVISYLVLLAAMQIVITDRGFRTSNRSKGKLIGYCVAVVLSGALAINEIRDHRHSCADNYSTHLNSSGESTDNPFSQRIVRITEDNYSNVCRPEFVGTSTACKEYRNCTSNPLYSIYLFLYLSGLGVAGALLYRELKKTESDTVDDTNPSYASKHSKSSRKKSTLDLLEKIKSKAPDMTVAELAIFTGKTERGVRSYLTRYGINAKDYDGASKKQES